MWDVKACVVCLSTECKLFKIDCGSLRHPYFSVSGLKASDMAGLPTYLCVECSAYVRKFHIFRDKCKRAHFALRELLKSNKKINIVALKEINRKCLKIAPSRSYLDLNRTHFETVKFKWEKLNRGTLASITKTEEIPVFHCSTVELENDFQVPRKTNTVDFIKTEIEDSSKDFELELNNQSYINTSTSNDHYFEDDHFGDDVDMQENDNFLCKDENDSHVDGASLDQEYATITPISLKEATAACEVYKMFRKGDLICQTCQKSFSNQKTFDDHQRRHDQHISGNFECTLCKFYYKTEFLLKTHMTEKHMYKYVCKRCPEVNFDRMSAKHHFIWTHLQKEGKVTANYYDGRPSWLRKSGGKRVKGVVTLRPVRKINKLPDDFPIYTPVSHEEQYRLIEDRKKSRNYLEATYKCELCYRGFREAATYGKHMKKHDPALSGGLQCDMCKLHFHSARKVYKHMITTHLFKYSCQVCNYICYNKGQAHMHYRWHKNVTYSCPHCDKVFKKASTRLTHIRIKHPSTIVCNLCGHSFVSENGLYCHKKLAHSQQEIDSTALDSVDVSNPQYCADCDVQFVSAAAYKTHLGSSNKHANTNVSTKPVRLSRAGGGRGAGGSRRPRRPRIGSSEIVNTGVPTANNCEICNKFLSNDVQARRHYESEHPGADLLKRYMCDVCGHTTRQYANLMVHMRTHTQEKPYGCPHCDRRFSMPSNRDRHLVVHTGEKKYQCQHCSRRFTQSSAVKLHIQTVHLKIPYAPWDKKNRKRRKELEGAGVPASEPRLLVDAQGDYINAYITYSDE